MKKEGHHDVVSLQKEDNMWAYVQSESKEQDSRSRDGMKEIAENSSGVQATQ